MSSLNRSLGPQGRALLNQQSHMTYSTTTQSMPQELDFLVNDLRNPKPDASVQQTLGYIYHYLPYVKNEHNLRVVFASFLNSPVCFGGASATFEQLYPVLEAMKAITDKKLKVSQPTLPVKTFYTVLLKEMQNFVNFNVRANSWKVVPILTGMFLLNELRDQLYSVPNPIEFGWFMRDWDMEARKLYVRALNYSLSSVYHDGIVNLSIMCLAITFRKDQEQVSDYTDKRLEGFMVRRIVHLLFMDGESSALIYSHFLLGDASETLLKPVIRHINRLAFLLEAYLKDLSFGVESRTLIEDTMDIMLNFNKSMSDFFSPTTYNTSSTKETEYWMFMKSVFFAQIVVFQGILTRFLTSNKQYFVISPWGQRHTAAMEAEYREISLKVLHNLYYLNFVLLSIGQGGFDSYNFVYYLATEIALKTRPRFQLLTMRMMGDHREVNLYAGVLNNDYIMRSKVLFALGLWENYLQQNDKDEAFVLEIFPLCMGLADDAHYDKFEVNEASHSVLLFCFSNLNLKDRVAIGRVVDYIDLLHRQFPRRLSAHQLSVATETLGKKILSTAIVMPSGRTSVDEFMDFVLGRSAACPSGVAIKSALGPVMDNLTFGLAQPILEIGAQSTLRNVDKDTRKAGDVVKANKGKKPKNLIKLDVLPHAQVGADYKFDNRVVPETTREAYILSVINLVPYLPLSLFVRWSAAIWDVILASEVNERNFLRGMMWKVLSENLDLNRMELAMRWWYEEVEVPTVVQSRL